jgi:hypothetical protein
MKILAQFVRGKKNIFIIFILLFSCSKNALENNRRNISTEIICPDGKKYMIRYAYAEEVKMAIMKDYKRKIRENSNENFTVIRIPNIESFHIHKITPEKMIQCQVVEDYINKIYPSYIKKFKK